MTPSITSKDVNKVLAEADELIEGINLAVHRDAREKQLIECPDAVSADEVFDVKVSLGKEVAHPNTTEHHIRWIQLYFKPEGDKFAYQVGKFEFSAHGESAEGPDSGPVYTNHAATAAMKINKPGTLVATAFCNIHGLWENSKPIQTG